MSKQVNVRFLVSVASSQHGSPAVGEECLWDVEDARNMERAGILTILGASSGPETSTQPPPSENTAERTNPPEWTLKMTPKEYLKRFPDGPNADIAKQLIGENDE